MELSKQVCSLELAKKLKELRFPQDSLFYWYTDRAFTYDDNMYSIEFRDRFKKEQEWANLMNKISAFTVAELGEMLPNCVECSRLGESEYLVMIEKDNDYNMRRKEITADTEADARAKMLVYLAENNLISK